MKETSQKTLLLVLKLLLPAVLIAGIIGWRIYAAITCNEEKDKCLDDCKSTYQTENCTFKRMQQSLL